MGERNARRPSATEIVFPNPQLEIQLCPDRLAVANARRPRSRHSNAWEKIIKPLLLFTALPQNCGLPSNAEQDPCDGSPRFSLLSAQMAASLAWLLGRCMQPAGPACASMVPGSKSHSSPRLGLGHKPGLLFRQSPRSESRDNHAGKLANVFHIPLSMTPELALKLC